ncbi:hypothetical protein [Chitinophaga sp. YIM B06452]|uniref:hypothetical protein n=1 Tax=Chitinophaga sp. YIM B06452 TaxID=3082158 RepID=UPI0031FF385D
MGAFNILEAMVVCINCGHTYEGRIQYKFGNTFQYHYKIGDKIRWGGNDKGIPGLARVRAYGIVETICPNCLEDTENLYDVIIEKDVITGINKMVDMSDYLEGDSEGNYIDLSNYPL